jgi:hypothetical protein
VKFFSILNKAMASVKERLESTPSLKGIESCYECVPLDSEKDLHDYYAEVMSFQYASKKKLQSDPALQNMLETYRLMCAHTDRRRLSMSTALLPLSLIWPDHMSLAQLRTVPSAPRLS